MFGLFRKKSPPSVVRVEPDPVYFDPGARASAVARYALSRVGAGRAVTVLTPFRGHIPALRELLSERGLRTAALDVSYRDAAPGPGAVYVLETAALPLYLSRVSAPQDFVQVERHPLRSHDTEVEATLEAGSREHRLRVYVSLDDGLLTLFDPSGTVKKLMASLDMDPAEPIEDAMVARAVENAQAKVAKRVRDESPADSFAEWRAINLREKS